MLNAWRGAVYEELCLAYSSLAHASDPLSDVSAPPCSEDWGITVPASPNCAEMLIVLAACRTRCSGVWCWLGICDKPSVHL